VSCLGGGQGLGACCGVETIDGRFAFLLPENKSLIFLKNPIVLMFLQSYENLLE
jgi:hypothetical protein